jgi:hypothetical protein
MDNDRTSKAATIQQNTSRQHTEGLHQQTDILKDLQSSINDSRLSFEGLCRDAASQREDLGLVSQMGHVMLSAALPLHLKRVLTDPRNSNYQIFQAIERLCVSLPAQVERQQPVLFRDALDHVAPIHLEWIDSHEAFAALLELRFKDIAPRKVAKREYVLQDAGLKDIDMSRAWGLCFVPGQRVDMSMTLKRSDMAESVTCPICGYEHVGQPSACEIKWWVYRAAAFIYGVDPF